MEPFEIMVSESQERMLCVAEPARVDEVLAVCARWEVHGTVIGEVTDTRRMRILRGDEVVGDVPVEALVDDCPLYDLAPEPPDAGLYPAPEATLAAGAGTREVAARAAGLAQHRLAPAAVRAVRLPGGRAHRAASRAGRRRRARPPARGRDRRLDRRQRAAGSPATRTAGRSRRCWSARRTSPASGAEPLGPDQLPELRQPREAAHRLAAHRVGPRARRRLPRARRPGRRRQRLALQRGRRRADLPDAGRRHGRRAARPGGRRADRVPPPRATRSHSSARSRPVARAAPSWPSCAASRCPTGCPTIDVDGGARRAGRGPRRRARRACAVAARTTSPRAGCWRPWPSAAWPAGSVRELVVRRRRGAAVRRGARRLRRLGLRRGAGRARRARRGRGHRPRRRRRSSSPRASAGRSPSCARPSLRSGRSSPSLLRCARSG